MKLYLYSNSVLTLITNELTIQQIQSVISKEAILLREIIPTEYNYALNTQIDTVLKQMEKEKTDKEVAQRLAEHEKQKNNKQVVKH